MASVRGKCFLCNAHRKVPILSRETASLYLPLTARNSRWQLLIPRQVSIILRACEVLS